MTPALMAGIVSKPAVVRTWVNSLAVGPISSGKTALVNAIEVATKKS